MSTPENQPDMSAFTADELMDLGYLAYAYATKNTTEQREVAEDLHRLEYGRYLVESGIVNEGLNGEMA